MADAPCKRTRDGNEGGGHHRHARLCQTTLPQSRIERKRERKSNAARQEQREGQQQHSERNALYINGTTRCEEELKEQHDAASAPALYGRDKSAGNQSYKLASAGGEREGGIPACTPNTRTRVGVGRIKHTPKREAEAQHNAAFHLSFLAPSSISVFQNRRPTLPYKALHGPLPPLSQKEMPNRVGRQDLMPFGTSLEDGRLW